MQAMAGAEFGGAEAFFVRLVRALNRAGLEQRVLIRENKARANSLRDAGIEPLELPFGGMLDRRTPRAFQTRDQDVPAADRHDLDEPGQQDVPQGRFRPGRPIGRLLRPEVLPHL